MTLRTSLTCVGRRCICGFYSFHNIEILKYPSLQESSMSNKSGAIGAPKTMRRFEKFIGDITALRRKRVTHDDALSELLKRAWH